MRAGSTFIEAGSEATNLTLLYSGRMDIYSSPKDGLSENVSAVLPIHFVKSPQWTNIIKCFHVVVFKDNDMFKMGLSNYLNCEEMNVIIKRAISDSLSQEP